MKYTHQIILGMALGTAAGLVFGEQVLAVSFIGTIFKSLIGMIVVPLVVSSLIVGVASLTPERLRRIGGKVFGLFLGTTAAAAVIGLFLSNVLRPGDGVSLAAAGTPEAVQAGQKGIGQILLGMIPKNPQEALVKPNFVQIIFFSLVIGLAISVARERGEPMKRFFESLLEVMMIVTGWVMLFVPIGVFGLMAETVGRSGAGIFVALGKYMSVVIIGLSLQLLVVYPLALKFLAHCPIRFFFKGMFEAMAVAFSTASSSATLPVTMKCAKENVGVPKHVTEFVFPVGATFNLDGTALYEAAAALFIAQAYGIHLGPGAQVVVVLTAALASIGAAGIPSAGLITMSIVLAAVGLPLDGIGLIFAIDWFLDRFRTMTNVAGDSVVACTVSRWEEGTRFSPPGHTIITN